jgi:hypothetical protein
LISSARKKPAPIPPAATPPAATPKRPKRRPKPECAAEVVTQSCGHKIGVKHLQVTPCSACLLAARQMKRTRRGGQGRKLRDNRLPQSSAFTVQYDAVAVAWTGTLTVPQHAILCRQQRQACSTF